MKLQRRHECKVNPQRKIMCTKYTIGVATSVPLLGKFKIRLLVQHVEGFDVQTALGVEETKDKRQTKLSLEQGST